MEFNEQGECVRWRQIAIIDPDVAATRAGYADEYRQVATRMEEMVRGATENPEADVDEIVAATMAHDVDEIRDVIARLMVLGVLLDQIDEEHGVTVDDAGMPDGEV